MYACMHACMLCYTGYVYNICNVRHVLYTRHVMARYMHAARMMGNVSATVPGLLVGWLFTSLELGDLDSRTPIQHSLAVDCSVAVA
jgi:hypothetical protein